MGAVWRNPNILKADRSLNKIQIQLTRNNSNSIDQTPPFCLVEEFRPKPMTVLQFFANLSLSYKMKFIDSSFNFKDFTEGVGRVISKIKIFLKFAFFFCFQNLFFKRH